MKKGIASLKVDTTQRDSRSQILALLLKSCRSEKKKRRKSINPQTSKAVFHSEGTKKPWGKWGLYVNTSGRTSGGFAEGTSKRDHSGGKEPTAMHDPYGNGLIRE